MKRFRLVVLICAVLVLSGLGYYFYGGSSAPSTQQPLVAITTANFASLQDAFNGAQGSTRLFVLVSPT